MKKIHRWRFFRAGGFDQAKIETAEDLLDLENLDQKLWVALGCPVKGIEFDSRTLELIDSDQDGFIRAPEIIAAAKWAGSVLKDAAWLAKGVDHLPLALIDDSSEEGKRLLSAAKHVLTCLGKRDELEISLADAADTGKIFAQSLFNGDGVVTLEAAESEEASVLIAEIADCQGTVPDRSGKAGIDREKINLFFAEIEALAQWYDAASEEILFLGDDTIAAWEALHAVKDKIEDYFLRSELAEYDGRAAVLLDMSDDECRQLGSKDLSGALDEIAKLPLSSPDPEKILKLFAGINPAWRERIERLALKSGLSHSLSLAEWRELRARFSPCEEWMGKKPATKVEKLGEQRVREIQVDNRKAELEELVERDLALEPEMAAICSLEKLLRLCRDLLTLANNFVSFRDFYNRNGKATFQAGTLYLDGRSCELCVAIADVNKHALLATLSRVCLAYCECVRGSEKMNIAAAFTAGDSDQLMVGRNGIFYDRRGRDWNATIVRIIEHPISIRQAFWAPYKRTGKMIAEQLQKIASSRSKEIEEKAAKGVLESGQKPPAFDVGKFAGIFAAIGLAVGAVGTAVATMVTGLLGLKWWQLPIAILGLFAAVSGPSVLMAVFKLRQRNLGPILDANGWAVNARALINIPFGTSLTAIAKLPEGAERSLTDPFAQKKHRWPWLLIPLLLLLYLLFRMYWNR